MGIGGVRVLHRPWIFACAVALCTYMQVSNMSTTIRTGYTPRLATIEHLGRDCSCNKNENAGGGVHAKARSGDNEHAIYKAGRLYAGRVSLSRCSALHTSQSPALAPEFFSDTRF